MVGGEQGRKKEWWKKTKNVTHICSGALRACHEPSAIATWILVVTGQNQSWLYSTQFGKIDNWLWSQSSS